MKKKFLKAAVLAGLICLVAGAGGCGQNREEASGETQEERGSGETEAAAKASEGSGAETEGTAEESEADHRLGVGVRHRNTGISQTIVKYVLISDLLAKLCGKFGLLPDNGFPTQHVFIHLIYHLYISPSASFLQKYHISRKISILSVPSVLPPRRTCVL